MPGGRTTSVALCAIAILLAIVVGCVLLRRALTREKLLPEELALAGAWVFVVGGFVWLAVYLSGSTLLGFGEPWTWLAAAHFLAAGFGALTVTALACRAVSGALALRTLRILLAAHPIAYLVTAAGISGVPYCQVLGAVSYELIFIIQLSAFLLGRPERNAPGPRYLIALAMSVPIATLLLSFAWALGHPLFDLMGMVRYHGLVNAVGHVGLGLAGFAWGRPPAHSPLRVAASAGDG